MSGPNSPAVILFAHGARDRRWAEPFARIADQVRAGAPGRRVELAYLECLAPDLNTAAAALAANGVTTILVVPLFFGRGGHLREAVPRLIAEVSKGLPGVRLELMAPAGEDEEVIAAIAAFCLRSIERPIA